MRENRGSGEIEGGINKDRNLVWDILNITFRIFISNSFYFLFFKREYEIRRKDE